MNILLPINHSNLIELQNETYMLITEKVEQYKVFN